MPLSFSLGRSERAAQDGDRADTRVHAGLSIYELSSAQTRMSRTDDVGSAENDDTQAVRSAEGKGVKVAAGAMGVPE